MKSDVQPADRRKKTNSARKDLADFFLYVGFYGELCWGLPLFLISWVGSVYLKSPELLSDWANDWPFAAVVCFVSGGILGYGFWQGNRQ